MISRRFKAFSGPPSHENACKPAWDELDRRPGPAWCLRLDPGAQPSARRRRLQRRVASAPRLRSPNGADFDRFSTSDRLGLSEQPSVAVVPLLPACRRRPLTFFLGNPLRLLQKEEAKGLARPKSCFKTMKSTLPASKTIRKPSPAGRWRRSSGVPDLWRASKTATQHRPAARTELGPMSSILREKTSTRLRLLWTMRFR